jgi:hypothetical protein
MSRLGGSVTRPVQLAIKETPFGVCPPRPLCCPCALTALAVARPFMACPPLVSPALVPALLLVLGLVPGVRLRSLPLVPML